MQHTCMGLASTRLPTKIFEGVLEIYNHLVAVTHILRNLIHIRKGQDAKSDRQQCLFREETLGIFSEYFAKLFPNIRVRTA